MNAYTCSHKCDDDVASQFSNTRAASLASAVYYYYASKQFAQLCVIVYYCTQQLHNDVLTAPILHSMRTSSYHWQLAVLLAVNYVLQVMHLTLSRTYTLCHLCTARPLLVAAAIAVTANATKPPQQRQRLTRPGCVSESWMRTTVSKPQQHRE
eukprot:2338-Heterococcus_DN1.PRE.10